MSYDKRSAYAEKLRDPRWQKRRLVIMERDKWECQCCFDNTTTLNVHHRWYENGKEPWESSDEALVTLCETCHDYETSQRKSYEDGIIRAMRKRFFAGDLLDIWMMLDFMAMPYPPEVVFSSLAQYLTDHDNCKAVVSAAIAYNLEKHNEKEAVKFANKEPPVGSEQSECAR